MNERITELFAFTTIDPADNTEGIVGLRLDSGEWMPMVGADMARIESLRPVAIRIARAAGITVLLSRYETRTQFEVIHPDGRVEPV